LATGYEPARLTLDETLKRGTTTKRIEMKPLPPLELTIVAPDGKPVSGATFTTHGPEEFRNTFDYAGDKRPLLNIEGTSNEQGIVRVAYPAFGDWAVYRITHSAGYFDLKIKDLPAATNPDEPIRHRIELAPYATIRGKYLPEVGENEFLTIQRVKSNRMHVDGPDVRIELDDQRRFQIARLLAGWYSLRHSIQHTVPANTEDSTASVRTAGVATYDLVKVDAGQTVDLTLGNEGRPVIGRLVSSDDVDFEQQWIKLSVKPEGDFRYPQAPSDITDDDALEAWWDAYWESEEGRQYGEYRRKDRSTTFPDESGRFRFPKLHPGKYELHLTHRVRDEPQRTLVKLEFEVPEGYSAKPLDLGDLDFSTKTTATGAKIQGPVVAADEPHSVGEVELKREQPSAPNDEAKAE